jgi:hypothetical protein
MRRFLMLLALFVAVVSIQSRVFPPMEGSDEPLHITYVASLRTDATLPDRTTYLENCTRQQSGGPPLWYVAGALWLDALQLPAPPCDAIFDYYYRQTNNPWLLSPRPARPDDNNTNFLPLTTIPPPDGFPAAVYALRWLSVAWGALAVVGAWLAAGEVFERQSWRLTAVAVFAFTPTFVHLSAYFTNDTPATAFTTWVAWQTLVLLRRGATWQRMAIIGLLVGAGALTKVSVLLVAPAVAVAVVWRIWQDNPRPVVGLRRVVVAGTVAAVPLLLTFGIWAGWGWLAYGDPFGTNTHIHPTLNYDPPLSWDATLRGLPAIYQTYVGLLGYANVYMSGWVYAMLTAVLLAGLVGLMIGWRSIPVGPGLALLALWAVTGIGFLRWYRTIFDVTGRLLMPAHIAYALALTFGLMLLSRWLPGRWLRLIGAGAHLLAGGVLTFVTLHAAYAPPVTADLPPLQGPTYTFDETIRLLGYHTPTDTITAPIHPITLCWEVLQPTDRLAAYAVRYVQDGVPVAQRTTVHGLGRYNSTLWQPGTRFCDRVDMPMGDARFGASPPQPGIRYDILLVMLDARSGAVNWTASAPDGSAVQFPVLGQVHYTGG